MSETENRGSERDIDDVLGVSLDANGATSEPPIPKRKKLNNLNESHFLQAKGLPYLRKTCAKSIKPRIQHKDDYKNLTNFLNFYQLWGHSIYPKANFKDFLEMTTKVGIKSRSVKSMREKFISEDMDKERQSLAVHLPGGDEGDGYDNDFGPDLEHISQQNEQNDDDEEQITRPTQRKHNSMFVDEDDEENYENDGDDDLYSVSKKLAEREGQVEKPAETEKEKDTNKSIEASAQLSQDEFDDEFDDDLDVGALLSEPKKDTTTNTTQSEDEIPPEFLNKASQVSRNPGEKTNYEEEYQDEWDVLEEIGQ